MTTSDDPVLIRYLRTPVQAFLDLQEALDAYQRELQLAALGQDPAALGPDDAAALIEVRENMAGIRTELHDQAARAREAGDAMVDLVGHYPAGARTDLLAIMDASRRADEAARQGRFLGPPLPDDVRHVQRWLYAELVAQLDGAAPRPFDPDR